LSNLVHCNTKIDILELHPVLINHILSILLQRIAGCNVDTSVDVQAEEVL